MVSFLAEFPWEFVNGTLIPLAAYLIKLMHNTLVRLKETREQVDRLTATLDRQQKEIERLAGLIRRWIEAN